MTCAIGRASAALLLVLSLALGACGQKGGLEAPKGEEGSYTGLGTYPAPESVLPQAGEPPSTPDPEAEPEAGEEGAESP